MKEKIKTLYFCDFCGKHYLNKVFGRHHEVYCRKNPNNQHKCFECINLSIYCDQNDDDEIMSTEFTCTAKHIELYSYVAERKANSPREYWSKGYFQEIVSVLTRMPLECDLFNILKPAEQIEGGIAF